MSLPRRNVLQPEELVYFALPAWYPTLSHITMKSKFVDIPQSFMDYLTSDGVVLPEGCELPSIQQQSQGEDEWEESDTPTDDSGDGKRPSFPDVVSRISKAIASLGGRGVLPKLNWSAPRDAVWITVTNSLCCTTPAEAILLLKSSDFIAHDISRISEINSERSGSGQNPLQPTLCLRRWREINPSSEFRCFVRANEVIGACQRDSSTPYPFLLPLREQLLQALVDFHRHKLHDLVTPENYVFDSFREDEGNFVLVDLNPFSSLTDSLLYSWEELWAWQGRAELRLLEPGCIQPTQHKEYRLPKDIVDLSTGEDIDKFVDLFHSSNDNALGKS